MIKAIRAYCPEVEGVFGLFGKLATAIQSPNENVQQFADRLQDLMHKIIESKKEEEDMTTQLLKAFTENMRQQATRYFIKEVKKEIRYERPQVQDFNQIVTRAKEIETLNVMRDNQGYETKASILVSNYETKNKQSNNFSCQICGDSKYDALLCQRAACVYCKETGHISNNSSNVQKKIILFCKWCSQQCHSISECIMNNRSTENCQDEDHEANQCPEIEEDEKCWKCQKTGHTPRFCSQNTQVIIPNNAHSIHTINKTESKTL